MSIRVTCHGCSANMNAPDSAAGKKLKCPKCAMVITVPSAAPAKAAAAPRNAGKDAKADPGKAFAFTDKKRASRDEENDRDEEDERPAQRKAGKSAPGSNEDLVSDLPEDQADAVLDELRKGERILWVGKPVVSLMVLRALKFQIFTLAFGMGTVFLFGQVNKGPQSVPIFVPIITLVLTCVFLSSPIFAVKKAKRTVYCLTHKRAVVWEGGFVFGVTLRDYEAPRLANMKRQNSWFVSGAGDLVFEEEVQIKRHVTHGPRGSRRIGHSVQIIQRGFMAIPQVNEIQSLIKREIIGKMMRALDDD